MANMANGESVCHTKVLKRMKTACCLPCNRKTADKTGAKSYCYVRR